MQQRQRTWLDMKAMCLLSCGSSAEASVPMAIGSDSPACIGTAVQQKGLAALLYTLQRSRMWQLPLRLRKCAAVGRCCVLCTRLGLSGIGTQHSCAIESRHRSACLAAYDHQNQACKNSLVPHRRQTHPHTQLLRLAIAAQRTGDDKQHVELHMQHEQARHDAGSTSPQTNRHSGRGCA